MIPHVETTPLGDAQAAPAAEPRLELSVVIKALNEAEKIEACLRSVLAVTDAATTEIIVADSLSDDETVAIASRFPVKVVQLARREDRGCGSAAQLGFQYARGKRLLCSTATWSSIPPSCPRPRRRSMPIRASPASPAWWSTAS